ncbi:hypothetical protein BOTCAL_0212g00110 [Botryotinia calthae]|uniref:Uncharacterized protein n=1 Tax=Botryotinia calthae TaxID=38488 RepID=A0A4Y8CYN9_9HELO|nr:hypothetical protein BOTCAL_0212g00110 [Botryotinia calthae]
MDKPNQATMSSLVHTLLIWEFADVAIPPQVIEFEANLPKSDGRLTKTQLNTGRATAIKCYRGDRWPIIDYHGRLTLRCAFSTEFQHAMEALLLSYTPPDLVYINRLNNAKRDITYRKNPFEKASEEDMRRITHLAFNYDNIHLELNHWLYSFIRYLVQQLRNVHVVTYFLRKSTVRSLQKNKTHMSGKTLSLTELRDRSSMHDTGIDESSDTGVETDIEGFGDIDDNSDFGSDDSDNDSESTRRHNSFPCRSYTGIEKTSKVLQRDWTWARWEWWKPI